MRTLNLFRPSVGAFAVGMAQAALEAAVRHSGSRVQFGSPLKEFQAVSHNISEMATRMCSIRPPLLSRVSQQTVPIGWPLPSFALLSLCWNC